MISAPVGLMKSANAYGRSSWTAHSALCADDPSSQISGRSGLPGSDSPSLANGWSGGMLPS